MVAKDTSYGSETYRPYLDIERIINVQSACSVNRGHDRIFLLGYTLRTIKESTEEGTEPPAFDNLGAMFIDGLKYIVVSIVYSLIPFMMMMIGIALAITSIPSNGMISISSCTSYTSLIFGSGLFLVGLLLLLVTVVILNIAIANMAHKDEFGAAFRFGEIIHLIGSIGWGKYIIWYIVIAVITALFSIVSAIVALIPLLHDFRIK